MSRCSTVRPTSASGWRPSGIRRVGSRIPQLRETAPDVSTNPLSADPHAPARAPEPAPEVDRASLAHRLYRIGAARVTTGNRVALLRDGPATFDAMLGRIAA